MIIISYDYNILHYILCSNYLYITIEIINLLMKYAKVNDIMLELKKK